MICSIWVLLASAPKMLSGTMSTRVWSGPASCTAWASAVRELAGRRADFVKIWVDDRDTATMDAAELRRGMGYVIQQAGLFPHRTVADNIAPAQVIAASVPPGSC